MAFTSSNFYNVWSGPPGNALYIYKSDTDTKATVSVSGYFNNADDDENLAAGDTIIVNGSQGGYSLEILSILAGVVTTKAVSSYDTITATDGSLLARVHRGGGDAAITKIEVWGDTTNKPDEGDSTVDGTLQWALDLLVTQATGGQIHLMGGGDYEHTTALSSTGDLDGIHIIGHFGTVPYSIEPATGTNLTYLWDFGDGVSTHDDFRIQGCKFYGKADIGNTSGGVRWKDIRSSFFVENNMILFKGVSLNWNASASGRGILNTFKDNHIVEAHGTAFTIDGSGGNVDHVIADSFISSHSSYLDATDYLVNFTLGGGSRMSNVHLLNGYGYILRMASSGWKVSNLYLDSGLAAYMYLSGSNCNFKNTYCYNGGIAASTANCIIIDGSRNNFNNTAVEENNSSNKIAILFIVNGDDNNLGNMTTGGSAGITGAAVSIGAGGAGNTVGFVSGTTSTLFNEGGGVTNVQVDSTSIP